MAFFDWLRSPRRAQPLTAAEIRRTLHDLREQRALTVQQRDLLALDAVSDEASALRWTHLDDTATAIDRNLVVLVAALQQVEARDAEAEQQAEAARREQAMDAYHRHVQDAQDFTNAVLARLPDGATLTGLRDLRNRLSDEARVLRAWSHDAQVRRPLDPLSEVVSALQHRIDRVSRARWAPTRPITLSQTGTDAADTVARPERKGA